MWFFGSILPGVPVSSFASLKAAIRQFQCTLVLSVSAFLASDLYPHYSSFLLLQQVNLCFLSCPWCLCDLAHSALSGMYFILTLFTWLRCSIPPLCLHHMPCIYHCHFSFPWRAWWEGLAFLQGTHICHPHCWEHLPSGFSFLAHSRLLSLIWNVISSEKPFLNPQPIL